MLYKGDFEVKGMCHVQKWKVFGFINQVPNNDCYCIFRKQWTRPDKRANYGSVKTMKNVEEVFVYTFIQVVSFSEYTWKCITQGLTHECHIATCGLLIEPQSEYRYKDRLQKQLTVKVEVKMKWLRVSRSCCVLKARHFMLFVIMSQGMGDC